MKGLLSVAFGTSHEDTRVKTIDAIEHLLEGAFPERAFYTAWTSGRIVSKVRKERGEHHDTLEEALERITADGIDDLVMSTMCLMDGHEMAKAVSAVSAWAAEDDSRVVRVATPLLHTADDRRALAQAVCNELAETVGDDALLLMGHGIDPELAAELGAGDPNEVYPQIQGALRDLGYEKFFVATVEGIPSFDDVAPLIEASGAKRVWLAPLMIVAGDHAKNDLAGEDEDSWKSMLEARGLAVEAVLRGLGEYAGVRSLICEHAQVAQPLAGKEA